MLLSETLHVERTFANEIAEVACVACVSPSRAPVLSFARYFQAPATQAIAEGNYIIFNSKLSIVSTLEAIPKPDSAEVCLIHGCSRPLGYAFKSGSA